jgi:xylan 1,4-beta-xylosidase
MRLSLVAVLPQAPPAGLAIALVLAAAPSRVAPVDAARQDLGGPIVIRVDASSRVGAMQPMWAWFGYDEPTTPTANGRKLLRSLRP